MACSRYFFLPKAVAKASDHASLLDTNDLYDVIKDIVILQKKTGTDVPNK
jgi:hypothetical protein